MPKYVIERRIPNAGQLSGEDLHSISVKSNCVLAEMQNEGKQVQWIESYVSQDAIHCLYFASDPEAVREHATRGGFPADSIFEVRRTIDPTTGE